LVAECIHVGQFQPHMFSSPMESIERLCHIASFISLMEVVH